MSQRNLSDKLTVVGSSLLHKLDFEFDRSAGKIFVTGGHGILGYRVASRLLKAGFPSVRVGALHPEEMEDLNKLGAEVADFAWSEDELYETALQDIRTVFCTPPHHEGWDLEFELFLKACQKADVKHIVKVSFCRASESVLDHSLLEQVPLIKKHFACDELLMKSGISYTILGASHLMSNPLVYQGKFLKAEEGGVGVMYGASEGRAVNYVSPNDVAEAAVRALLAPLDHVDKIYNLTGPLAVKEEEVANLFAEVFHHPVLYKDQGLEFFEREEMKSGDPSWLVEDLVQLEKIKATGREGYVTFLSKDFERMCGHAGETYESYLLNKDDMSPLELRMIKNV
jgi:uncharacterized protein YbjT (DUF2867 family)